VVNLELRVDYLIEVRVFLNKIKSDVDRLRAEVGCRANSRSESSSSELRVRKIHISVSLSPSRISIGLAMGVKAKTPGKRAQSGFPGHVRGKTECGKVLGI